MASEPKVGDVRQQPGYQGAWFMWLGDAWHYVGNDEVTRNRLSAELSAAREMREVLLGLYEHGDSRGECPFCSLFDEDLPHAPDCRLARLIGGNRG